MYFVLESEYKYINTLVFLYKADAYFWRSCQPQRNISAGHRLQDTIWFFFVFLVISINSSNSNYRIQHINITLGYTALHSFWLKEALLHA